MARTPPPREQSVSVDCLDLLLCAAVAHACARTTRQLTFDRVHGDLGRILAIGQVAASDIAQGLHTELFYLEKDGLADKTRVDAIRALLGMTRAA